MYRAGALTLTINTFTPIPFDTIEFDPGGSCTTGATARYTCPVDGYYSVSGALDCAASAASQRLVVTLMKNGSEVKRFSDDVSVAAQTLTQGVSVAAIKCVAGDYLQVTYFSPNALVCNVGQSVIWCAFAYVGPA